jgi:hypothetical protein
MQTLESPPPLGHSVVESREILERSDVDQRECTAQLEPLHGLLFEKKSEMDREILEFVLTTLKFKPMWPLQLFPQILNLHL